MTSLEPDGDLVELQLAQVLRRPRPDPPIPPMSRVDLLPCSMLPPPVFERLTLEYLLATENPRSLAIYGKSGHAQFGLDIVGKDRISGQVLVAQCRRTKSVSPAAIRRAVVDYAGPPLANGQEPKEGTRRFGAKRFLYVTAAATCDNPAIADEVFKLNEEYAGDLEIELHGVELISARLRDAVGTVAGIFGPEWARALCGSEPPPAPANQATWFGLLEGPISALELEEADNTVTRLTPTNPLAAAELDLQIAAEIEAAGYPGQATAHRHRAAEAFWLAGERDQAFDLQWELCVASVERGERIERALRDLRGHTQELSKTQLARLTALETTDDWDGQGSKLEIVVPALEELVKVNDEYAGYLACQVLEQALVDELFDESAGPPIVGDGETPRDLPRWRRRLVLLAKDANAPANQPLWRVRLRCAIADVAVAGTLATSVAEIEGAFDSLHRDASTGRIKPRYGFLAFTRSARAHAVSGHKEQALSDYRRALSLALQAGLGGDVREISSDMNRVGHLDGGSGMYGIAWAAKSLPNDDRLIEGARERRNRVLEWLRTGANEKMFVRLAFTDARRCLWSARVSGNIDDELWAWEVFGDVLHAAKRPASKVRALAMAGKGKEAANTARESPDLIDVAYLLNSGSPWSVPAAADVMASQANLVPDSAVENIISRLLKLAVNAESTPRAGRSQTSAAINALRAFAHRISGSQLDELIDLLRPSLQVWTHISDDAAEILGQLYDWNEHRRPQLADMLSDAANLPHPEKIWQKIHNCRRPGDQLERLAIKAAEEGVDTATTVLANWGIATPAVARAARRSTLQILQVPVGQPRLVLRSVEASQKGLPWLRRWLPIQPVKAIRNSIGSVL